MRFYAYRVRRFVGIIHLTIAAILCTVCATSVRASSVAHTNAGPAFQFTPANLRFPKTPADGDFLRTGLFTEPLVPVTATQPQQNRDLARALLGYRDAAQQAKAPDAVQPLGDYLAAHPKSPWAPAVELNMGIIYRQTGHFSKALAIWQDGWDRTQNLTTPHGRALGDALVARLSQ